MLNIKNEKCLQQTLMQEKERLIELTSQYESLINVPPEQILIGNYISCTAGEAKKSIKDILDRQKADVKEYENMITPHIHLCKGCTDEYYLTRRGFGREDCPLKKAIMNNKV